MRVRRTRLVDVAPRRPRDGRLRQHSRTPSITFTKVPPAAKGGPDVLDTIEGRITGARPGQRLVLYARSSVWWVQPSTNMPFTEIRERLHLFGQDASRHGVRRPARRTRPSTARHAREPAARRRIGGPPRRRARRPEGETACATRSSSAGTSGPSARRRAIAAGRISSIRRMPGRMATARCTSASPAQPGKWTCAELTSHAELRLRPVHLHRRRHLDARSGGAIRDLHLGWSRRRAVRPRDGHHHRPPRRASGGQRPLRRRADRPAGQSLELLRARWRPHASVALGAGSRHLPHVPWRTRRRARKPDRRAHVHQRRAGRRATRPSASASTSSKAIRRPCRSRRRSSSDGLPSSRDVDSEELAWPLPASARRVRDGLGLDDRRVRPGSRARAVAVRPRGMGRRTRVRRRRRPRDRRDAGWLSVARHRSGAGPVRWGDVHARLRERRLGVRRRGAGSRGGWERRPVDQTPRPERPATLEGTFRGRAVVALAERGVRDGDRAAGATEPCCSPAASMVSPDMRAGGSRRWRHGPRRIRCGRWSRRRTAACGWGPRAAVCSPCSTAVSRAAPTIWRDDTIEALSPAADHESLDRDAAGRQTVERTRGDDRRRAGRAPRSPRASHAAGS